MVAPIGEAQTKGAWFRQWRLVSLDGSTLDVADTAENEKAFDRPGTSRGSSTFPKIRFVASLENGTHVLWAARMDRYATDGDPNPVRIFATFPPPTRGGSEPLRSSRAVRSYKLFFRNEFRSRESSFPLPLAVCIHFPTETMIHITGIGIHFLRNRYSHAAEYAGATTCFTEIILIP